MNFFCRYCPCGWCDGNKENNKEVTGYEFIPNLRHCKEMLKRQDVISYETFVKSVFALHGSTINDDWEKVLKW